MDRVITLPELAGPLMPGVPAVAHGGFIPVAPHCRSTGLERVFAAGDATDFAIKHGGIAAQQADMAAAEIAALAGAQVERRPFDPKLRAILLGGERAAVPERAADRRPRRNPAGQRGADCGRRPTKIAAPYLAPYLAERDRANAEAASEAVH